MNMQDLPRTRSLRRRYLPAAEACRHQKQSRESAQRSLQTFAGLCRFSGSFGHVILFAGSKGDGCDRSNGKRCGPGSFHSGIEADFVCKTERKRRVCIAQPGITVRAFYPDMPYGNEEIRNPVDGDILIRAAQHDEYRSGENFCQKKKNSLN